MNNKGIAIDTILLLLVGIIVVGIMVYLVFKFATGPGFSVQECKTKMTQYCTICANVGWTGITTSQDIKDCAGKYPELSAWNSNTDCVNSKDDCEALGVV